MGFALDCSRFSVCVRVSLSLCLCVCLCFCLSFSLGLGLGLGLGVFPRSDECYSQLIPLLNCANPSSPPPIPIYIRSI